MAALKCLQDHQDRRPRSHEGDQALKEGLALVLCIKLLRLCFPCQLRAWVFMDPALKAGAESLWDTVHSFSCNGCLKISGSHLDLGERHLLLLDDLEPAVDNLLLHRVHLASLDRVRLDHSIGTLR